MTLTIGQIILLICILLFGIISAIFFGFMADSTTTGIICVICGIIVTIIFGVYMNWHNTSTASGIRYLKDYQSELSNGIEREITITAEDGRKIYHDEGKFDIESNHEDNYIKYEREDGKRMIIYYGITDTIIIEEK